MQLPKSASQSVHLFGPMRADLASGGSFLPHNRRTRGLLAVLVLAEAKPVERQFLLDLLWPARGRAQAQASLRQAVHELRGLLAPLSGASLASERDYLALQLENTWIDVIYVQMQGFRAQDVMEVLRGRLLGDFVGLTSRFDVWILAEERRLSERIGGTLSAFLADSPSRDATKEIAEAVLRFDRTHENAWIALARCHVDEGDESGALDVYHRCLSELRKIGDGAGFDPNAVLAACRFGSAPPALVTSTSANGTSRNLGGKGVLVAPGRAACVALAPTRRIGDASRELAAYLDWEIVAALCRFDELSFFSLDAGQGSPFAPEKLVQDGFDFLLEGCIERVDGEDRFSVRLRDLQLRGAVFWSQRFSGAAAVPGFSGVGFLAPLAPQIAGEIAKRQAALLESDAELKLTSRELVLKAARAAQILDRQALADVDTLLSEAIKRDRRQPALLTWLAYVQTLQLGQGWSFDAAAARRRIAELVEKALSLLPDSAGVLSIAGHVLAFSQHRLEEGMGLQERALAKNPNLPMAWLFSGLAQCYAGLHREGINRLERARTLSPADHHAYFIEMGLSLAHLLDGSAGVAMKAASNAVQLNPNFSSSYKVGAAASGCIHQDNMRAIYVRRLLLLEPAITVRQILSRAPLIRSVDQERLFDGLCLAGLQK